MRFYTKQHAFYCGIDLHARSMYVCILDQSGKVIFHRNVRACPDALSQILEPYGGDIVVGVECIFTWYWMADYCSDNGIPFVLGHALYMKAIHGGKAKNDRIDSRKIAGILRGGTFPLAYVYPREMRSTRDLLRRRMFLMRSRAELLTHVQNTNHQCNLEPFSKKLCYRSNRKGIEERFTDDSVRKTVQVDLALIDTLDDTLRDLELFILRQARLHDSASLHRLRTVPGIGKILALVILYEVHDVGRFPRVQNFVSYARLVKCAHESAGKKCGTSGHKIGNAHLKWAFSEAAVLFLRNNQAGQRYLERLTKKHGRGKALGVLAAKLGRAVYFMLSRGTAFDLKKFVA